MSGSKVEHCLHDGSMLVLQGNAVARRYPDGRVRDHSWWPLWKVADLLRMQKVGGFDGGDERALRRQQQARRHPPFATLTAPVNWQDLAWQLGVVDSPKMVAKFAAGEIPYAEVSVEGRERLRIEASERGAERGCRVCLYDDGGPVNARLIGAIASILRAGGKLLREPNPSGGVTLVELDGAVSAARLLQEPTKALAILERVGAESRDVRIQCDVQWLVVHELTVRQDARHLVVDF